MSSEDLPSGRSPTLIINLTCFTRCQPVLTSRPAFARLQMSNTFYESAGQNWFTLDSVHIHYNWTHEATFNATDVYAPSTNSYHCQHVSSLQKYDTLLVPSSNTDNAANWHITFTDFQVRTEERMRMIKSCSGYELLFRVGILMQYRLIPTCFLPNRFKHSTSTRTSSPRPATVPRSSPRPSSWASSRR